MLFHRLSTSQAIYHTLNIEKCKYAENYKKKKVGVHVRSKPFLIDVEWPPSHCPKFQRPRNIKVVPRPSSFESQRVLSSFENLRDEDPGGTVLVSLFPF